jgi:hypothetical protein
MGISGGEIRGFKIEDEKPGDEFQS